MMSVLANSVSRNSGHIARLLVELVCRAMSLRSPGSCKWRKTSLLKAVGSNRGLCRKSKKLLLGNDCALRSERSVPDLAQEPGVSRRLQPFLRPEVVVSTLRTTPLLPTAKLLMTIRRGRFRQSPRGTEKLNTSQSVSSLYSKKRDALRRQQTQTHRSASKGICAATFAMTELDFYEASMGGVWTLTRRYRTRSNTYAQRSTDQDWAECLANRRGRHQHIFLSCGLLNAVEEYPRGPTLMPRQLAATLLGVAPDGRLRDWTSSSWWQRRQHRHARRWRDRRYWLRTIFWQSLSTDSHLPRPPSPSQAASWRCQALSPLPPDLQPNIGVPTPFLQAGLTHFDIPPLTALCDTLSRSLAQPLVLGLRVRAPFYSPAASFLQSRRLFERISPTMGLPDKGPGQSERQSSVVTPSRIYGLDCGRRAKHRRYRRHGSSYRLARAFRLTS